MKEFLQNAYFEVEKRIKLVDFDSLWRGFRPFPFALYDDETVVLGGQTFDKTEEFLANTAIIYKGDITAIWNLTEETDYDVLAAKLIHEMFHGYQRQQGEKRFANEWQAVRQYEYTPQCMQLKYEENKLLSLLLTAPRNAEGDAFVAESWRKFLSMRASRRRKYRYQYDYESDIEAIEGPAEYVELAALTVLCEKKAAQRLNQMAVALADAVNLIPVRIISYAVGAAVLTVCNRLELDIDLSLTDESGFIERYVASAEPYQGVFAVTEQVADVLIKEQLFMQRTIEQYATPANLVDQGEFAMVGFNVYNGRFYNDYLLTEYFLCYLKEGKEVTLFGNYLVKTIGDTLTAIYAVGEL